MHHATVSAETTVLAKTREQDVDAGEGSSYLASEVLEQGIEPLHGSLVLGEQSLTVVVSDHRGYERREHYRVDRQQFRAALRQASGPVVLAPSGLTVGRQIDPQRPCWLRTPVSRLVFRGPELEALLAA
jgi:hypothetical protein